MTVTNILHCLQLLLLREYYPFESCMLWSLGIKLFKIHHLFLLEKESLKIFVEENFPLIIQYSKLFKVNLNKSEWPDRNTDWVGFSQFRTSSQYWISITEQNRTCHQQISSDIRKCKVWRVTSREMSLILFFQPLQPRYKVNLYFLSDLTQRPNIIYGQHKYQKYQEEKY